MSSLLDKQPYPDTLPYEQLCRVLAEAEAISGRGMADAVKSPEFARFMAGDLGVEATSIYVTSPSANADRGRYIDFLYNAARNAANPPMFNVRGRREARPFKYDPLSDDEHRTRRDRQRNLLLSAQQYTSAELCIARMREGGADLSRPLLLSFGEILAYCFVYRLAATGQTALDRQAALEEWSALCSDHARPDEGVESRQLLSALHQWYTVSVTQQCYARSFLKPRIEAIYTLSPGLRGLLTSLTTPSSLHRDDLADFIYQWGVSLLDSLERIAEDRSDLKKAFWQHSLINPDIERVFRSRGLYVTAIRSRTTKLSEAYAICTLHDSMVLEDEASQTGLSAVLRHIAHEDLASYDSAWLERTSQTHQAILDLQDDVFKADAGWSQLTDDASLICQNTGFFDGVLLAVPGNGVRWAFRAEEDGAFTVSRYGPLSAVASVAGELAQRLPSTREPRCQDVSDAGREHLLRTICTCLDLERRDYPMICAIPVGKGPRGLLMLFASRVRANPAEVWPQLLNMATVLTMAMAVPFRGAIGRGLISTLIGTVIHPRNAWRRLLGTLGEWWPTLRPRRRTEQDVRHRRRGAEFLRGLDVTVATIVELTTIGLAAIGGLLALLVFLALGQIVLLLWQQPPPHAPAVTGGHSLEPKTFVVMLDYAVMAFSMCVTAKGIVCVLKPEMRAGQPEWLNSFAKTKTLEQSLIRLASVVLSIHMLSSVLEWHMTDNARLMPVMCALALYLGVLVGLGFVQRVLLNESDEDESRSKQGEPNEEFTSHAS